MEKEKENQPVTKSNIHPLFEKILSPFMPKEKKDVCANCGADNTHKVRHLTDDYRCNLCNDYWN